MQRSAGDSRRPVGAARRVRFPSTIRQVELFGADDLDACNDVMSPDRDAMNATEVAILLLTKHDRASEEYTSEDTERG